MALANPLPIPRHGTAMPGGSHLGAAALAVSPGRRTDHRHAAPAADGDILGNGRGTDDGHHQQQHHRGATDRFEGL
jgi:hypothetical protein